MEEYLIRKKISYEEMQAHLADPLTRIVDSRMVESLYSFSITLQVLQRDNTILETTVAPHKHSTIKTKGPQEFRADVLDLFKLQYRNNPRNNPALYGLLDESKNGENEDGK